MNKPPIMPLSKALWILSEAHTRDDLELGFTVERTPWPGMGTAESREYVEAWRSVRFNTGKQSEAAEDK